jgi:hypothetical protein
MPCAAAFPLEAGARIDRGLSYACGGMHGETEYGCESYFCSAHLTPTELVDGEVVSVCPDCLRNLFQEQLPAPNELEDYAE